MFKTSVIFLGTFMAILWIGVGILFFEKFTNSDFPPQPEFVMDNKNAFYTISKEDTYFVSYSKSKNSTSSADAKVLVGNSPIDLDQFVNKPLKITGWFKDTYGYRQCIVDVCKELPQRSVVIDITKVEIHE